MISSFDAVGLLDHFSGAGGGAALARMDSLTALAGLARRRIAGAYWSLFFDNIVSVDHCEFSGLAGNFAWDQLE